MIKRGRLPRIHSVALRARVAELVDRVIRIRGAIVIGLMATIAVRRQPAIVLSICMALAAGDRRVRAS
jgi:hypothetical protein